MAGIPIYTAYVTPLIKGINSLEEILKKGDQHAKENGIDADVEYIPARLFDDMHPLPFQVLIATNMGKMAFSALTGKPVDEKDWKPLEELKSFADCYERIEKTQKLLQTLVPEEINGKADDICEL